MLRFPYASFWLNLLLPSRCVVCDSQLYQQGSQVCPGCWKQMPLIHHYCLDCGRPYSSLSSGLDSPQHQCGTCRQGIRRYFTRARSIGLHQGVLKQLIHLLKYRQMSSLGSQLASWMIRHMPAELDPAGFDGILPVPIHIKRLRKREYNQSLLLAKSIAQHYQRPLMPYNLYRQRFHKAQVKLSRKQRMANIKGAFAVRQPHKLKEKSILLIDDVYTTGATVSECAKALLKAGASRVEVLTLARTEERNKDLIGRR